MRFETLIWLLPLVLAVHNAEEYAQHARFSSSFPSRLPGRLGSRRVVGGAMVLVTLAATALCIAAHFSPRPPLVTAVKISIFALGWNALGHVILSLRRRTMLPGTVTAIVLVLPYSATAALAMHTQSRDSAMWIAPLAAAGAVALPAFIGVAVSVAYALSRIRSLLDQRSSGRS